jgi:hypothetical protein
MAISPKKDLERRQRRWAERAGVAYDARGFVREAAANFRVPLSAATCAALARGSELVPRRTKPPRIAALHSSTALVANVFEHWCDRDASPLAAALGCEAVAARLSFEEPLPTGLEGDPPLVDVLLRTANRALAIESKFSEWLVRRPPGKAAFKPKYFPPGRPVWLEAGLPRCQRLADDLRTGAERFKYLHAAQLLKHALGLVRAPAPRPELRYLYYAWPGRHGEAHRADVARFAERVGGELSFAASTYQELFAALRRTAGVDQGYLAYLSQRYFADVP